MNKIDEFDSAGQALGYISLDQAVLEPRKLARRDDQLYRNRLGWDEIVWTELDSQKREDSYGVVLQFRTPTYGLEQKQTGQEEFVFDLIGNLLDRQVLVWPDASPGFVSGGAALPSQPPTLGGSPEPPHTATTDNSVERTSPAVPKPTEPKRRFDYPPAVSVHDDGAPSETVRPAPTASSVGLAGRSRASEVLKSMDVIEPVYERVADAFAGQEAAFLR